MTDNYHQSNEWADQHRQSLTTRHTHEDVLTDREFELLLEACSSLAEPHDLQARFVRLAAGRLGLRAGEVAHFRAEWLDWGRLLLRIPQHEPCQCGYCHRQASQEVAHNEDLTRQRRWRLAGIRRRWPLLGRFQLTCRSGLSCVSNGSQTSTKRFHGHEAQSTDAYQQQTWRISTDGSTPLPPSDRCQLSCPPSRRARPSPDTDGLERLDNSPEVYPNLRESNGRCSAPSPSPMTTV